MTPLSLRETGRRRLAMHLPQLRQRIMEARDLWQLERFEAYQLAIQSRDALGDGPEALAIKHEHDETCLEIEEQVLRAMGRPPRSN